MAAKELILNCVYLKNRVTELGIKQWWLAEQVGVDRKTVIRWLQGKVKSIQRNNAEALVKVLNCQIEDLCHSNEAENLATPEDQRIAASLIASSSLVEKLGPIGEWNVIESLLKATIVSQLPLNILGDLYIQLTVASWRQSKMEQAELYNVKALEISEKSNDQKLRADALLSRANLLSWRGKPSAAIATYEECLSLKPFLNEKTIGSIFSNLGAVLYEAGDLIKGLEFQERAIESFQIYGTATNLSIAYCHEALIYLQMENWQDARAACDKSKDFAKQDDYRRGGFMCSLIDAELLAREGRKSDSVSACESAMAGFLKLEINEGLNFEFAGRIYRLIGEFQKSESYLRQGLEIAQEFPMYLAALYVELAMVLFASNSNFGAVSETARKAREIYLTCGAPIRVKIVEKVFKLET